MKPKRSIIRSVLATVAAVGLCLSPLTATAKKGHTEHHEHREHKKHRKHKVRHHHAHSSTHHAPPRWAPAYGYRRATPRRFHYYPSSRVYYEPATRQYFWLDGGAVQLGIRLPSGIRVGRRGVTVELDRDRPDLSDFNR